MIGNTTPAVERFDPDRADGWALFLGADALALRWEPLRDDGGTPYTTDYYQLGYLRERAAWGPELLLLPYITTRWGRLYVHDKDALVITVDQTGDRWLVLASEIKTAGWKVTTGWIDDTGKP